MSIRTIILGIALAGLAKTADAQMLAVKTNVAFDAVGVPSLALEMTTGNRSTLSIAAAYANKTSWLQGDSRITLVQPEWRVYLSGRPMHSHFVGIGAVGADYNLHIKGKWYNGNAAGLGVVYGYAWTMSKRWNLDIHFGVGAIRYKQKEYFNNDNYDDYSVDGYTKANAKGWYILPTNLGLTLSYIIK